MSEVMLPDAVFERLRAGWANHERQKAEAKTAARAAAQQQLESGRVAGRKWAAETTDFAALDVLLRPRQPAEYWLSATQKYTVSQVTGRQVGENVPEHFARGFAAGVRDVLDAFDKRLNAAG